MFSQKKIISNNKKNKTEKMINRFWPILPSEVQIKLVINLFGICFANLMTIDFRHSYHSFSLCLWTEGGWESDVRVCRSLRFSSTLKACNLTSQMIQVILLIEKSCHQ